MTIASEERALIASEVAALSEIASEVEENTNVKTLNDLNDVCVNTPNDGELLEYDGSEALWKAGGGHNIASHSDTTVTGAELDELAGGGITTLHSHADLDYIKVTDTKAQNTNGGTFTAGSWQTRDLTTEDTDTGDNCSLSSNQITLAAGTYECCISCPCYEVDTNQARLYNTTGAEVVLLGTTQFSAAAGAVKGRFTIAADQILEVQHYCITTRADYGFGIALNQTSEVYTVAEFWKVS